MVNEEIVIALRNAVERGENLQVAAQSLVNSGYNAIEVQEASNFVGGVVSQLTPKPGDYLSMPGQGNQPSQAQVQNFAQEGQQIKQAIGPAQPQMTQQYDLNQQMQQQQMQQPPMQDPNIQMQDPTQMQQQQQMQQPPIQDPQMQQQQMPPQQTPGQQTGFQIPTGDDNINMNIPPNQPPQSPQSPQSAQSPMNLTGPHSEESILFKEGNVPKPTPQQLSTDINRIGPPKKSHAKEIILLVILLILIGVLILTIVYRDTILGWFS